MTSLQETLLTLTNLLSELPAWTDELARQAAANEAAANELLKQITNSRDQAEALREIAAEEHKRIDLVHQIRRGVEPRDLGCENGEELVEALLKLTRDRTAPVVETGDAIQDGMRADEGHFAETADTTRESHEQTETQFSAAQQILRAGQELLQSALDAAAREMQSLRDAVSSARSDVSAAAGALRERLSTMLSDGRVEVERTGETLGALLEAQQEHLTDLSGQLEARTETLIDTVRLRVESEVHERVTVVARQLAGALVTLGETAAGAQEAAAAARSDLEERFDALGQALAPMPAVIEQVKQAAREVGLLWE